VEHQTGENQIVEHQAGEHQTGENQVVEHQAREHTGRRRPGRHGKPTEMPTEIPTREHESSDFVEKGKRALPETG
jgi:hypothetical protein